MIPHTIYLDSRIKKYIKYLIFKMTVVASKIRDSEHRYFYGQHGYTRIAKTSCQDRKINRILTPQKN